MKSPKGSTESTLLTIIITAIIVGGAAYIWQNNQQTPTEVVKTEVEVVEVTEETGEMMEIEAVEDKPVFESMASYVELANKTESSVGKPEDLVRVEFGGMPVDVKLPGASVPVYVYTKSGWDVGHLSDEHMFYLKMESPAFLMEDPSFEKQEFWHGPYYGKLALLVQ